MTAASASLCIYQLQAIDGVIAGSSTFTTFPSTLKTKKTKRKNLYPVPGLTCQCYSSHDITDIAIYAFTSSGTFKNVKV